MLDPKEAAKVLAAYDAQKEDEARELIKDMPVVQLYIETHRPVWVARRGSPLLDEPLAR
jgi:hypothetical protein